MIFVLLLMSKHNTVAGKPMPLISALAAATLAVASFIQGALVSISSLQLVSCVCVRIEMQGV